MLGNSERQRRASSSSPAAPSTHGWAGAVINDRSSSEHPRHLRAQPRGCRARGSPHRSGCGGDTCPALGAAARGCQRQEELGQPCIPPAPSSSSPAGIARAAGEGTGGTGTGERAPPSPCCCTEPPGPGREGGRTSPSPEHGASSHSGEDTAASLLTPARDDADPVSMESSEEMERGGISITGPCRTNPSCFIREGTSGFHSPPSSETKAAIVAAGGSPEAAPTLWKRRCPLSWGVSREDFPGPGVPEHSRD